VKLAPNHEANRALASASTLVSPYSSFDTCKYRLGHTGSSINVKNDKSGPEAEVGEGKGVQGGSRDSGHVSGDLSHQYSFPFVESEVSKRGTRSKGE
jgi:hypothetical protein